MMKNPLNPRVSRFLLVALLVLVILGGLTWAWQARNKERDEDVIEAIASPTPSPTATPTESPSPTPSPSVSPTASPSSSPTATSTAFPETANKQLTAFYAAFVAGNRKGMEAFFTTDASAELRSLRSRLFTGADLDGTPGGPTLFDTSSASQKVTKYQIDSKSASGGNYIVMATETRTDLSTNQTLSAVKTKLILTPSADGTSWLIDSYTRVGGTTGKYDALINP